MREFPREESFHLNLKDEEELTRQRCGAFQADGIEGAKGLRWSEAQETKRHKGRGWD